MSKSRFVDTKVKPVPVYRPYMNFSKTYKPNGKREVERRKRQMEK